MSLLFWNVYFRVTNCFEIVPLLKQEMQNCNRIECGHVEFSFVEIVKNIMEKVFYFVQMAVKEKQLINVVMLGYAYVINIDLFLRYLNH